MALADDLAEAFTVGAPTAAPDAGGLTLAHAATVQAAVIRLIDLPPVGVRVARGPDGQHHAGPIFAGRLHQAGATLSLEMLPKPAATAAVLITLAQDTPAGTDATRLRGSLRPALDIAASRLLAPPTAALFVADLAGLGAIVAGPPRRLSAPGLARAAGPEASMAIALALDAFGDLPAGAMLLLADLSPPEQPLAGDTLTACLPGLAEVAADFV